MTGYRQAIWQIVAELLQPQGQVEAALDFGSGDGWFARQLAESGLARQVVPVEVKQRAHYHLKPVLYDGQTLPLADRSCRLTMAIDSLHHTHNPQRAISELLRVTGELLLIKDHTYAGPLGYATLAVLDELGNWRFGVPSPFAYQRGWAWRDWIETAGFELVRLVHPAPCHRGLLGRLTNGLQFVALWKRRSATT